MYQQEMFSGKAFKDAVFLASGCYGRVHAIDDNWVVKYAIKDGTLNYLEWCKRLQDAGKGMLGMPEIESIVHLDDDRYMVTMRRYDRTLCSLEHLSSVGHVPYHMRIIPDAFNELQIGHITELIATYDAYMHETFGPLRYSYTYAGDLHAGNFMLLGGLVVMTDPSSCEYMTKLHEKELVLQ